MENYKDLYFTLFNKVSDVIIQLQEVQKDMEEMYLMTTENDESE